MSNKLQIKRTTVSGRTPNTTNSANNRFIDIGELAINTTDGKLFSSDGTGLIEFGTATPVYDEAGNLISNTFVTTRTAVLAGVTVNILPATDETYSLGNTSNRWLNVRVSNTVSVGNSTVNTQLTATTLKVNNNDAINGPAFSAYADNTAQNITSGSQQKVLFQVEEFDTNNNYANSRFTPTVPGYYQLNAEVRLDGDFGTGETMIVVWKNGSEYKRGWNASGVKWASNFGAMTVSTLVYANGTTDYFEIYAQQTSGSTMTVTAVNSQNITWFNGAMVRGA